MNFGYTHLTLIKYKLDLNMKKTNDIGHMHDLIATNDCFGFFFSGIWICCSPTLSLQRTFIFNLQNAFLNFFYVLYISYALSFGLRPFMVAVLFRQTTFLLTISAAKLFHAKMANCVLNQKNLYSDWLFWSFSLINATVAKTL